MSQRLTWPSNSTGHDGTYVYRSTAPMDPQALPAPIGSVAAGVAEYVDGEALADGAYYYRVQDYQGASVSTVSAEVSVDVGLVAAIGDEVEGGIYAGTITYADGRKFHIIVAKDAGVGASLVWGNLGIATGADDPDDGQANQDLILASYDNGDSDAFYHCRDYAGGGYGDWYLPARNELTLIYNNLSGHAELANDDYTWSSTEDAAQAANRAWFRRLSDGTELSNDKDFAFLARPVRRIAA